MKSLKRLLDETYLSQFEPLNDQLTSGVGGGLGLVVFKLNKVKLTAELPLGSAVVVVEIVVVVVVVAALVELLAATKMKRKEAKVLLSISISISNSDLFNQGDLFIFVRE